MAHAGRGFNLTQDVSSRQIPVSALTITGTGTGSAQTVYTTGAQGLTTIDNMFVRNTTGTAATLTFHAIPTGDSIGDANELLPLFNVPAQTTLSLSGLIGGAYPASMTFEVFSGTNGALVIWGTVGEWK